MPNPSARLPVTRRRGSWAAHPCGRLPQAAHRNATGRGGRSGRAQPVGTRERKGGRLRRVLANLSEPLPRTRHRSAPVGAIARHPSARLIGGEPLRQIATDGARERHRRGGEGAAGANRAAHRNATAGGCRADCGAIIRTRHRAESRTLATVAPVTVRRDWTRGRLPVTRRHMETARRMGELLRQIATGGAAHGRTLAG